MNVCLHYPKAVLKIRQDYCLQYGIRERTYFMGEISQNIQEKLVIVRGAGDLATGVIQKLWHVGFKILVLETECPLYYLADCFSL